MDKHGKSASVSCGIGLWNILACIISWTTWHSIPWAIVHGIFSWFYIIYWALTN